MVNSPSPDIHVRVSTPQFTHSNAGRKFDCIFIRNVLIYFDRESKQTAVNNLIDSLAPRGALVVGPADGIYDLLGRLNKKTIFLYEKPQ